MPTPTYSNRGSEWRKWDLHLHSPGTKLNDQFKVADGEVWDVFCDALAKSDVDAFGIADYFSATGYLETVKRFRSRHPDSTKVFFPNIELRTSDVVNKADEEVHLHLLFDPFRADCDDRIQAFLDCLDTSKTDANGRHVKAAELQTTADFEEATTTRDQIQKAFEMTYGDKATMIDALLVITAANNDGIRPQRGKKRKEVITDELDKFSHAFFGSSRSVEHFLSTDRLEDPSQAIDPKPVFSGCDAHSLPEIEERLGQVAAVSGGVLEPTWIKADLTFEGLKQTLFEPANRVFIGEEPEVERRVRENKTRYIESLRLTSIEGYDSSEHGKWFEDEHIPLGKELVAIIGNKGSGKSALTDIIGLLGNSHTQVGRSLEGADEELFSFLNRRKFLKGGCAANFQAELRWHGGDPRVEQLDAQVAVHLPERVEYLPQKYLERICANVAADEFRATLDQVIFRYVPESKRHRRESLDDLIRYLSQQARETIAERRQELHEANEAVVAIEKRLTSDYKSELEERLKTKRSELKVHAEAKPALVDQPPERAPSGAADPVAELSQSILSLTAHIEELEAERIRVSSVAEDLRQLREAIRREVTSLWQLGAQYKDALDAVSLTFDSLVKVEIHDSALETAVAERTKRLQKLDRLLEADERPPEQASDLAGKPPVPESLVLQKMLAERERANLVDQLEKPQREYQQYLRELEAWQVREDELRGDPANPSPDSFHGLQRELERLTESYPEELRAAQRARANVSRAILVSKCEIPELYNRVKGSIDTRIAECRDRLGDYAMSIEAGLRLKRSFFDEFLRFINQRSKGSFKGLDEGRQVLRRLTQDVPDWGDGDTVLDALSDIVEALHVDTQAEGSQHQERDVFKQIVGDKSVVDLYDYLFGFKYLEAKYELKVDGKELDELSPGERGGLLLVFYLMLDRQEIPLVIDQPEDNLDNKSVYEILVTFIKEARRRRQIILVTHNPNLAVVADAEQIVHVAIDKTDRKHEFDCFSGSIENPRINRKLVDILEGTLPAFDNRRLKYHRRSAESP